MNLYKSMFLACALSLGVSSINAAEPIDGWYSSLFGGYANIPNNLNHSFGGITRNNSDYKAGFDVGGSFGYKSTPMRYEGEVYYINADLKKFYVNNVKQTGVTGENNSMLAMVDVYYDFINGPLESIQPFVGFGIGYGWVEGKFNSTGPNSVTRYTGANSVFAYQASVGLTYNFAENYALNLFYRYLGTEKVDDLGKMFQANLFNVGVIYRFDGGAYK